MLTNKLTHQRGVGLIEVLVAVLLLSVAVLGFSALQVQAVSATDESLVRTKSLTVVRNLAEVMRAYPEAYVTGSGTTFTSSASDVSGATPTIQAVMSSPATNTVTVSSNKTKADGTIVKDTKTISILASGANCLSTEVETVSGKKIPKQPCSIDQLAARDALMVKKIAADEEIKLAITTCPGTSAEAIQQQMCIVTAWNDTKAIMSDSDTKACATNNGVYKTGSHCLISEAY